MSDEEKENKLDVVSVRLNKDAALLSEKKIHSPEDAVRIVGNYLSDMDREMVAVVNVDSKGTPINCSFISIGTLNQALVEPRELMKTAILSNAANIIILHNHPSGDINPSLADHYMTRRMDAVTKIMGIPLLDHIIIGRDIEAYYSFRENKNIIGKQPDSSKIDVYSILKEQTGGNYTMESKMEFESITISKRQIIGEFEKDGKKFSRILTPGGYTFVRPSEQIHDSKFDADKAYFSLPKEFQITMQKSRKNKAGEKEGYTVETKEVSATELSDMFEQYNNKYVMIEFSKAQIVGTFEKNGEEYSRILAPNGSTFVRKSEQISEKDNSDRQCCFMPKDNYTVTLSKSMRVEGVPDSAPNSEKYRTETQEVSPTELQNIMRPKRMNKKRLR